MLKPAGARSMQSGRYDYLDGLRGVAAIVVTLYHITQYSAAPLMRNAYFSVDLFFVLSGFVIANAYMERIAGGMSVADFMTRRLRRLYPMFAVGLILGLVATLLKHRLGQVAADASDIYLAFALNSFYVPSMASNVTVTMNGHEIAGAIFPLNGPAWTLFYEIVVNFVFFMLWQSGVYSRRVLVGLILASCAIFFFVIARGAGGFGWGDSVKQVVVGFDRTLFGFASGVLLAALPKPRLPASASLLLSVLLTVLFVALCILPYSKFSFLAAIATCPALVYCGSLIQLKGGARRLCEWLGLLSYPLYCIHFPLFMMMDATGVFGTDHAPAAAMAGLCGCIAVAALLERYLDKPLRQRLQRWPGFAAS